MTVSSRVAACKAFGAPAFGLTQADAQSSFSKVVKDACVCARACIKTRIKIHHVVAQSSTAVRGGGGVCCGVAGQPISEGSSADRADGLVGLIAPWLTSPWGTLFVLAWVTRKANRLVPGRVRFCQLPQDCASGPSEHRGGWAAGRRCCRGARRKGAARAGSAGKAWRRVLSSCVCKSDEQGRRE